MRLLSFLFALSVSLVPTAVQDREREVEHFDDGTQRVERHVVRDGEASVLDGPYRRWHPNGQLAVDASYADGALDGPFATFYADGQPMSKGQYSKGRRTGKWELFHANGQLAAVGDHKLGLRDRRWVVFDPIGVKVEEESGLYRVEIENYESRERRYVRETLDKQPHGRWVGYWEPGGVQFEGRFDRGRRAGWWEFRHMDGTLEPEYLTGWYEDGERVGGARVAGRSEPFRVPEEDPDSGRSIDSLADLPSFPRPEDVKPSERVAIRGHVTLYLDGTDAERQKSEQLLLHYGPKAIGDVLNALKALDLEDAEGHARATALDRLLRGMAKGRSMGWAARDAEGALATNRLAVLRWFSWYDLARRHAGYWRWLAREGPERLLGPALFDGDFAGAAEPRPESTSDPVGAEGTVIGLGSGISSKLFLHRDRAIKDRELRNMVQPALEWLARHQSPEGSWSPTQYTKHIPGAGKPNGIGSAENEVGVTGLALLALMAEGNTSLRGKYSENVRRGIGWLVRQREKKTGLIVSVRSPAALYNHAIATLVLSEALLTSSSPLLRVVAQGAVDACEAARNPEGVWRYDIPPNGDNDTSITAWMVAALKAADDADLDVDEACFEHAAKWIDAMTERSTGRIGYTDAGSPSARVFKVNDTFSTSHGEALTAAGLYARLLLGQSPSDSPLLEMHAGLLLKAMPLWDDEQNTADLYYWFYGSHALYHLDDDHWLPWKKALREALGPKQVDDEDSDEHGSWPPNTAWGFAGGRVYSTAIATLALQAQYRYPRIKN